MRDDIMADSRPGLTGPLLHVAFLLVLLIVASNVLQKSGVSVDILSWASLVLLTGTALVPAIFVFRPGFASFSCLEAGTRPALPATMLIAAIGPGGLALAFLSLGMSPAAWTALGAAILGMVFSQIIRVGMAGRSDPLQLGAFVEARFNSSLLARATTAIIAVPLLAWLCGQAAAFGHLAQLYLGIPVGKAVLLCILLAVLQIWISGVRGLLLGCASLSIAMAAISAITWIRPEAAHLIFSVEGSAELVRIAQLAIPFVPLADMQSADWPEIALAAVAIAAGFSVLPVLAIHARRDEGRHDSAAFMMAVVLFAAIAFIFHGAILNNNGGLQMALSLPGYWLEEAGIAMTDHIALLVILMAVAITAAIPLFVLGLLVAGQVRQDMRGYLPARQLAAARIAIPVFAGLAAVLTIRMEDWITIAAQFGISLAGASILPVLIAGMFFEMLPRACGAAAMTTGAVAATGWFVAQPALALRSEVSFLHIHPIVASTLLGVAAGTLLLLSWTALHLMRRKGE